MGGLDLLPMAAIQVKLQEFDDRMNDQLSNIPLLVFIDRRTDAKVKKSYIVYAVAAVLFLFVLFGVGAKLICDFVGFVFPAYCSIKAIESKRTDDDTQWLTYWIVFGLFSVLEYFTPTIYYLFSWYFVFKFFFVLWLLCPLYNGAEVIYRVALRPLWGRIPALDGGASAKKTDAPTKGKKLISDDSDSESE